MPSITNETTDVSEGKRLPRELLLADKLLRRRLLACELLRAVHEKVGDSFTKHMDLALYDDAVRAFRDFLVQIDFADCWGDEMFAANILQDEHDSDFEKVSAAAEEFYWNTMRRFDEHQASHRALDKIRASYVPQTED